jgi:hypothetical protein
LIPRWDLKVPNWGGGGQLEAEFGPQESKGIEEGAEEGDENHI